MTIIVFLIDTSASMNQRAFNGGRPTLIDVAKSAVETFVKFRSRNNESRGDRYMLLTFDEPPHNVKAGWKESLQVFMNELRNLQATSMTTIGQTLGQVFDLLNINRMTTGIDTYGMGRCPWYLEPSFIVVITDGGKLSTIHNVQNEFNVPINNQIKGIELTREPFRWDQRMYALVLRMSGTPPVDSRDPNVTIVPSDCSIIDTMCEVTGGRSYCITTQKILNQVLENLVLKVTNGVVIHFEKHGIDPIPVNTTDLMEGGEDLELVPQFNSSRPQTPTGGGNGVNIQNTAWHSCRKLIYVGRSTPNKGYTQGYWPIPESFWPDSNLTALPVRSAQPNVKFVCINLEPMVVDNFPFDKYELEPSPLTQHILSRKQPNSCWQVFVPGSSKNSELGFPFGYLKASGNLLQVNLFIMPYNYPVCLSLIDDFYKVHHQKPTQEWRNAFQNYIRSVPFYYIQPLKRALLKLNLINLIPGIMPEEPTYQHCVTNYLKLVKTLAKAEQERLITAVAKAKQMTINDGIKLQLRSALRREIVTHPLLQDKFSHLREQMVDFNNFIINTRAVRVTRCLSYRNPFDVPRKSLLDQLVRMRSNFGKPLNNSYSLLHDDDEAHSMPVSQMGNYQEYLKRSPPNLRELESAPVRQHIFGNPFKLDKRVMVDEADMEQTKSEGGGGSRKRPAPDSSPAMAPRIGRVRKPGPLPRDYVFRRPCTPYPSPACSPRPLYPSPLMLGSSPYSPASPAPPLQLPEPEMLENRLPTHLVNGTADHSERARSPSPELIFLPEPPLPSPPPSIHLAAAPPLPPAASTNHVGVVPSVTNHLGNSALRVEPRVASVAPVQAKVSPEEIKEHNNKLLKKIFNEIKRPGKVNMRNLIDLMMSAKGDSTVRRKLYADVVSEAKRYKKTKLVSELEKWSPKEVNGQAAS
ncbi:integrator complex subunit 6 [Cloeon dipterum]|uniref:integrator complex subunit 6 n=1 Tax=Cloeon dipterum TaxID=197152 RepID=UPI0032201C34